jgi:hypothetical protein
MRIWDLLPFGKILAERKRRKRRSFDSPPQRRRPVARDPGFASPAHDDSFKLALDKFSIARDDEI